MCLSSATLATAAPPLSSVWKSRASKASKASFTDPKKVRFPCPSKMPKTKTKTTTTSSSATSRIAVSRVLAGPGISPASTTISTTASAISTAVGAACITGGTDSANSGRPPLGATDLRPVVSGVGVSHVYLNDDSLNPYIEILDDDYEEDFDLPMGQVAAPSGLAANLEAGKQQQQAARNLKGKVTTGTGEAGVAVAVAADAAAATVARCTVELSKFSEVHDYARGCDDGDDGGNRNRANVGNIGNIGNISKISKISSSKISNIVSNSSNSNNNIVSRVKTDDDNKSKSRDDNTENEYVDVNVEVNNDANFRGETLEGGDEAAGESGKQEDAPESAHNIIVRVICKEKAQGYVEAVQLIKNSVGSYIGKNNVIGIRRALDGSILFTFAAGKKLMAAEFVNRIETRLGGGWKAFIQNRFVAVDVLEIDPIMDTEEVLRVIRRAVGVDINDSTVLRLMNHGLDPDGRLRLKIECEEGLSRRVVGLRSLQVGWSVARIRICEGSRRMHERAHAGAMVSVASMRGDIRRRRVESAEEFGRWHGAKAFR